MGIATAMHIVLCSHPMRNFTNKAKVLFTIGCMALLACAATPQDDKHDGAIPSECATTWTAEDFTTCSIGLHRLRFEVSSTTRPEQLRANGAGPLSISLAHILGPGSKDILGQATSDGDGVTLNYEDFVFEPTELSPGRVYEVLVIAEEKPSSAAMAITTSADCASAVVMLAPGC